MFSVLLIPVLTTTGWCQTQEKTNTTPEPQAARGFMVELEELAPTQHIRSIHTTNLHLLFRAKSLDFLIFRFYGGLTVSHSSGTLTKKTGSSEDTLQDEVLDSTASGAGPVLAARTELARGEKVSAWLDGSAGVLLYDRDFPTGGSRYNFMLRIGPTLTFRLNDTDDLSLTLRIMHVSNGQGFVPHNPEYNAVGLGVQFLRVF